MPRAEQLLFSKTLFNPNFYHLLIEMKNAARRFLFCYGGSSSAKSYSVAQGIIILACLIEGSDTLVFRKVSSTIKRTIKKDFVTIIKNLQLQDYFTILDMQIRCYNEAVIDFSGIDDPEKIKGISSYKRVVMEEISEFDHADYKQVRKRLRGMPGQQIIAMFNPIDVDHWIKTEVFDVQNKNHLDIELSDEDKLYLAKQLGDLGIKQCNSAITEKWIGDPVSVKGIDYPPNIVVMKSTFENNYWVVGSPCKKFGFNDVQTQIDFEADRVNDWDFFNVYALGNWGKLNVGGECYKNFDTSRHTGDALYDPEKSLHLTFDENVNPYMTLNIHQGEGLRTWQVDEICLPDPRNTLAQTLKEFKARYPNNGNSIYIYGDSTSKKADVKLEKGKNFYTLIENQLKEWGYVTINRVAKSNPNPEVRINWMNQVFSADGYDDIEITISNKCAKTIGDYKYLKAASDGSKHKERVKHPVTKVVYEKYGHNTDANDYFYCIYYQNSFKRYSKPQGGYRAKTRRRSTKKGY